MVVGFDRWLSFRDYTETLRSLTSLPGLHHLNVSGLYILRETISVEQRCGQTIAIKFVADFVQEPWFLGQFYRERFIFLDSASHQLW